MLPIPSYWLPRPAFAPDTATRAAFEHLFVTAVAPGTGESMAYTLAAPKWQFLTYLADQHQLALHGSGNPDIAYFEPRQSPDIIAFGNRRAVYAVADGIWPMFFAIVDRDHFGMTVVNACVQYADAIFRSCHKSEVTTTRCWPPGRHQMSRRQTSGIPNFRSGCPF